MFNGYERDKDDDRSKGRPWKNPWLIYKETLELSLTEKQLLKSIFGNELFEENKTLIKKR